MSGFQQQQQQQITRHTKKTGMYGPLTRKNKLIESVPEEVQILELANTLKQLSYMEKPQTSGSHRQRIKENHGNKYQQIKNINEEKLYKRTK